MNNQFFDETLLEDKYGVPASCRLPASLDLEISDEAERRQISKAKHLASIIINARQGADASKEQIENLIREKNLKESDFVKKDLELKEAQQTIIELNARLSGLLERNALYQPVWDGQLRNEAILQKLYLQYKTSPINKDILYKESFDFSLLVREVSIEGKTYYALFNYAYRLQGTKDIVIQLLENKINLTTNN